MAEGITIIVPTSCIPCRYKVHRECEGDHCECPCPNNKTPKPNDEQPPAAVDLKLAREAAELRKRLDRIHTLVIDLSITDMDSLLGEISDLSYVKEPVEPLATPPEAGQGEG